MALTRTQIIDAGAGILSNDGLGGLSMRRLAQELGVQPGALYHHIASKQELLAAVGEQLLSGIEPSISTSDPAQAAADIRTALTPIRDGAEVISFVHAYRPDALGAFRDLHLTFGAALSDGDARLAAEALIRYVLGCVAVEQNRAELVRARIMSPAPSADTDAVFMFGVQALLAGLKRP